MIRILSDYRLKNKILFPLSNLNLNHNFIAPFTTDRLERIYINSNYKNVNFTKQVLNLYGM